MSLQQIFSFCSLNAIAYTVCLLIAIALLLNVYHAFTFSYWSRQKISGPRPFPLLGNLLDLFLKPMHEVDLDRVNKFGLVYGMYEGSKPTIGIADPILLKQIMVKDFHIFTDRRPARSHHPIFKYFLVNIEGDEWRKSRSTLTPTFTSGKIKSMFELMTSSSGQLVEAISKKVEQGEDVELKQMFGCYTLDVIAKCCFATDTNTFEDPNNVFLKNAVLFFVTPPWRVFLFFLLPMSVRKAINLTLIPSEVSGFFVQIATKIIRDRKASGNKKYHDFVQLLLNANESGGNKSVEKEIADGQDHHLNEGRDEKAASAQQFNSSNLSNHSMSEKEMVANSVLFLAAGYETTGSLLTFGTYALALNPLVQHRLYEETKQVVDKHGQIDYDLLAKNEYLDAFVSETLRVYSPAVRVERVANQDTTLGEDKKIKIPKGMIVQIPVYAIHKQAQFYPQPEQFDPTRFLPENKHKLLPYTYLPFGAGPRNCIGMRFALVEAKLALVKVVQKFQFQRSSKTAVPLAFRKSRGLLQVKEAIVAVVARK